MASNYEVVTGDVSGYSFAQPKSDGRAVITTRTERRGVAPYVMCRQEDASRIKKALDLLDEHERVEATEFTGR